MLVRMVGYSNQVGSRTLWYAFLISTLLALLLIPRTSASCQRKLRVQFRGLLTVEVDFFYVVHCGLSAFIV